jgi:hypothetical protein
MSQTVHHRLVVTVLPLVDRGGGRWSTQRELVGGEEVPTLVRDMWSRAAASSESQRGAREEEARVRGGQRSRRRVSSMAEQSRVTSPAGSRRPPRPPRVEGESRASIQREPPSTGDR